MTASPDRAGLTKAARDASAYLRSLNAHDANQYALLLAERLDAALATGDSEGPGLDVERLARALHAFYAGKDTRDEFFPLDCTHREDAAIIAVAYGSDDPNAAIAAEYARPRDDRAGT